jgi:hypothetical protein
LFADIDAALLWCGTERVWGERSAYEKLIGLFAGALLLDARFEEHAVLIDWLERTRSEGEGANAMSAYDLRRLEWARRSLLDVQEHLSGVSWPAPRRLLEMSDPHARDHETRKRDRRRPRQGARRGMSARVWAVTSVGRKRWWRALWSLQPQPFAALRTLAEK